VAIVPFEPRHVADVIDVIATVFREYGATFELAGFDADLADIPRHYLAAGGVFVVLEDAGRVVGTAAAVARAEGTWEVKRVYLRREYRGRGHGRALIEHVLARAEGAGGQVALAWSDTRFVTAHGVYERLGFVRVGQRTLADVDRSREYGFRRRLSPETAVPGPDRTRGRGEPRSR
jgi:putative acetyltransferase